MNPKEITIIVATHKKYKMPSDIMYLPVQVGAQGKESIGFQRDDEGDNISELNPFFCELTGLYWAWKHLDSEYIGLAHYRRHFSLHPRNKDKWSAILKFSDIEKDLEEIRVFVPNKRKYYIETLYSHYEHTHHAYQLDASRKIISETYPEYLDSFDKVMAQRWGYMFNMMIMERELLDEYCRWLFNILFELRETLGETGLDNFHRRYYGRISEILFNVWLAEKIRDKSILDEEVKEIPYVHMEKINWINKGGAFLKAKFFGKKYKGSF